MSSPPANERATASSAAANESRRADSATQTMTKSDTKNRGMSRTDSSGEPPHSFVRVVNPEWDGMAIELEFYDETMEGVDGVTMPEPPEPE